MFAKLVAGFKEYGDYVLYYCGVHLLVFLVRIPLMKWKYRKLQEEYDRLKNDKDNGRR